MFKTLLSVSALMIASVAHSEVIEIKQVSVTDWKAVYGEVEPRDLIPARARIGGTVQVLAVTEGDTVVAGQQIAMVQDDKLAFQLDAIDAQLGALQTQLATAKTDLERGESLRERGVITVQNLDQLRTAVDVLDNQIRSIQAQRLVIEQQVTEGAVLSPVDGVVLSVPVARGSVINPGEQVAQIGGGGVFLRLALPERFAGVLAVGDTIEIGSEAGQNGTLIKVYPQIAGGRVLADVEVDGLDGRFIGRRVPVRVPVGAHDALLVPQSALSQQSGLDFVTVEAGEHGVQRTVVPGDVIMQDGVAMVEILSGLRAGDKLVTEHE